MPERTTISPDISNGRPVIRGTRIAVQTVLEFLGAGDSVEEVLEEYPDLTREDVQACLNYASCLMEDHLEMTAGFKENIERSEREMAEGRLPRVR